MQKLQQVNWKQIGPPKNSTHSIFQSPSSTRWQRKKKSCYEAENPHALLIVGTYKYFLNEEVIEGKKLIEKTLACGNFITAYIHGIMLLCESNPKGIGNI